MSVINFLNKTYFIFQAKERIHAFVQPKEGQISQRRILLEEKERWKNYKRGSHEIKSSRNRGNFPTTITENRPERSNLFYFIFSSRPN